MTSASRINVQESRTPRATWLRADIRKKVKRKLSYCTDETQEHNFENEGDPHLYGSYIQKPVA